MPASSPASDTVAGLLSHTLLIGGRSPNKILFAKSSGRVWQMDFYPMYEQRGMLERTEPVRHSGLGRITVILQQ